MLKILKNAFIWIVLPLFLLGCAELTRRESNNLFQQGLYVESVQVLEREANNAPNDTVLRAAYLARQAEAIAKIMALANDLRAQGNVEAAATVAKKVFEIAPANERTKIFLVDLERTTRHQSWLDEAQEAVRKGQFERAQMLIEKILRENTKHAGARTVHNQIENGLRRQLEEQTLTLAETRPVSLEFRDANLKMVFEVLARHAGINFVLDKDVRADARVTIFLRDAQITDAIDLLTTTNQLNKKILNNKTVLIYPNSAEKQREYQDLLVKSIFLANAEAKNLGAQIKTMLKLRDVLIDEKLNALVLRDTPEAIRVAERVIALLDVNEPEVMLEVEVLEVNRTRLYELGLNVPNQFTFSPLTGGATATINFLRNINSDQIGVSFSNPVLNLRREIGDVNMLANPRIRAKNKEKAKILIGERLPVVTTTTSTGVVTENIQYTEVGVKLEVEPLVSLDDEVSIKVALEVSSVTNQTKTNSGSIAYQIGTRNANTVLKLRDGETQILAGLLSSVERSSANRIPGLGDIPVIGRLFGSTLDNSQKTELVLSITPRLVRNIRRPDIHESEFWSGTDARLSTKPVALPLKTKSDPKLSDLTNQPSAPTANPASAQIPATPSLAPPVPLDALNTNALPNPTGGGAEQSADQRQGGVTSRPPSKIELNWQGSAAAKVNQIHSVQLELQADGAVRGMPLQITFDPSQLQIIEVQEGNYFKQDNGSSSFSYQALENKILVGMTRNGMQGVFGKAPLLTIRYRPLKVGESELKVMQATALGEGNLPTVIAPIPFKLTSQ